jgi:hypothetical protein
MSELVTVALALGWFGLGALGVWIGNSHLDREFPEQVNRRENALAYVWVFAGPCALIGALLYVLANPRERSR